MRVESALLCFATVIGSIVCDKILDDGLIIETIFKPEKCDNASKIGDYLKLQYKGTLEDGTIFDSSYDRSKPFQFELGAGRVIKGWDEGLQDMCVGEKRRLIVPPELGYGKDGFKSVIPPDATLTFEVELLSIDKTKAADDTFVEIDTDKDGMLSQDEVSAFIRNEEKESGVEELTSESDHNNLVADIFQNEDLDKDGFISSEEFFRPRHEEL